METQASKSPHPLMWVAAIALIVFCAAGVAAMMGWIPTSFGKPDDPALSQLGKPSGNTPRTATAKTNAAPAQAPVRAAPTHAPVPVQVAAAATCAECGVVQSVTEIDTKGEGSGLGAVGGAVVGGLLGSQVGGGDGKKVMAAVGAVGGAIAGNEVEKRVKSTRSYAIAVRFDDGSSRVINEANAPSWRSGDRVKVVNGVIQSNG